jgi:prepilin-type N-terminal cleavage/methylation domain-containing protein/prepilin-type processing-associated H-X9-DG protein
VANRLFAYAKEEQMMSRRRGFTLIELLVVISIIGILAAMVFPVFARARESARKAVCLSNVKNIALAIQMYLSDNNDTFWPGEHRQEVADFFNTSPGNKDNWDPPECGDRKDLMSYRANPYLRPQAIIDEYVKNRDVWRCPSAKVTDGAYNIVPIGRDGLWLNAFADNAPWYPGGVDGGVNVCEYTYPSGWGGDVTDSFKQGHAQIGSREHGSGPAGNKVFIMGIGYNDNLAWGKLSHWQDLAKTIACADSAVAEPWNGNCIAYPDLMNLSGCGFPDTSCASGADWANCAWSRACGLDIATELKFFRDPNLRKNYTRHMGGSNVGFLDGHAKWLKADELIFRGCGTADPTTDGDLCPCWYPSPLV